MVKVTDNVNGQQCFATSPKRIVSLVPSQTELLYSFGLDHEVVGITKFCVHPEEWFRTKKRVGGTKTVNINAVAALQPDLIIANKEENVQVQVEELQKFAPVYTSDISNLPEAVDMILTVGELVDRRDSAIKLAEQIINAFTAIKPVSTPINTAYLIWKDPFMAAGGDTFINDLVKRSGFINILEDRKRYPEVTIEQLSLLNCKLLLLSSEPYPFKQKHINELQKQLPDTKIMLADGEMFSWYGSRLLIAAAYLTELIDSVNS